MLKPLFPPPAAVRPHLAKQSVSKAKAPNAVAFTVLRPTEDRVPGSTDRRADKALTRGMVPGSAELNVWTNTCIYNSLNLEKRCIKYESIASDINRCGDGSEDTHGKRLHGGTVALHWCGLKYLKVISWCLSIQLFVASKYMETLTVGLT